MGRKRRKGKRGQLQLSKLEKNIVSLNSHKFEDTRLEQDKQSLLRQYITKDTLTRAQQYYISQLAGIAKKEKRLNRRSGPHYLYAIECGDAVKIGHSTNPEKRMASLQTANPETLRLAWKGLAGETKVQAENYEAKIHKQFKKYRIRGEWFRKDVLEVLQ